jgi:prepilin-type N-terminal cleavage/methylation domain-containing protein
MFSLQLPKRGERGFTLIELLVVIIIIGVLAAVAIPLFLDQRKLAADAAVKSDVRNTATQVQQWSFENPGQFAATTNDYVAANGKVVASTGNTVGVVVGSDGRYTVCGYATGKGKAYSTTNSAYVFDSATGQFGTGTCEGGIVGSGGSSSNPTSTPAPTDSTTPTTVPTTAPQDTGVPAAITQDTLPDGDTAHDYDALVTVDGTPDPTFALTAGSLPAGLQLDIITGEITGRPTKTGTSTFEITATNTAGSDKHSYTVNITAPAPSGTPASITTASTLPIGTTASGYSTTLAASGSGTMTWSLKSGSLPAGLQLSAAGKISGTIAQTAAGNYTFIAQVSNGFGTPATRSFTLSVTYKRFWGFESGLDGFSGGTANNITYLTTSGSYAQSGTRSLNTQGYRTFRSSAPIVGLTSGLRYSVTAYYWTGSSDISNLYMGVNSTYNTSLTPSVKRDANGNPVGTKVTFNFQASASTMNLTLGGYNGDPESTNSYDNGHTIYWDNITVVPAP